MKMMKMMKMMIMKKRKLMTSFIAVALCRGITLLLCLCLCLSAAGCTGVTGTTSDSKSGGESGALSSQGTSHEPNTDEMTASLGNYVETELSSFDDAYYFNLMQTKDALYLFGAGGCQVSKDGGKSWSSFDRGSPLAQEMEKEGYELATPYFGFDGRRLQALSKEVEYEGRAYSQFRYILHETDGTEREVEIRLPDSEVLPVGLRESLSPPAESCGTYLASPTFLADGTLEGMGFSSSVYHIDLDTGEILHSIEADGETYESRFTQLAATPSSLLVLSETSARLFSLDSWTQQEDAQAIDEFISRGREAVGQGQLMIDSDAPRYTKIYADGQEEAYYICDSTGIYRYMPGGVTVEQLVSAQRTTMSFPECYLQSFVKSPGVNLSGANSSGDINSGANSAGDINFGATSSTFSFKALFSMGDFPVDGPPPYSVLDYSFAPDAANATQQELKIYTLIENEYMQQAVAMFEKKHQNVDVTLEAGIDPSVSMETSDAIRLLNTQIMAGKGPDLIFMDSMSVENYQNKGLLLDVTGTVEEVKAEYDMLDNVTDIYKTDGKIYAVPASFDMPIVVGAPEHLEKITGFDALTDTIEGLRKENPDIASISGYRDTGSLINVVQSMVMPRCIKEDRTVDWDMVKNFYQGVARMNQADANTATEDGIPGSGTEADPIKLQPFIYGEDLPGLSIRTKYSILELRSLNSMNALPCLYTTMEEDGLGYKLLWDEGICAFTPSYIMGVNAKSQNPDQAKEFIKFMLSEEMQSFDGYTDYHFGLAVNADAIRARFAGKEGEKKELWVDIGDQHTLTVRNPKGEEIEDFIANARKLNRALATQDWDISDSLFVNCYQYQAGIKTLDQAIDAAREEIELYLAEG